MQGYTPQLAVAGVPTYYQCLSKSMLLHELVSPKAGRSLDLPPSPVARKCGGGTQTPASTAPARSPTDPDLPPESPAEPATDTFGDGSSMAGDTRPAPYRPSPMDRFLS
ncbi:hypothetical protein CRG98_039198 [Punica granatum]|uniref:Uncharacterized protein n=1 Tax=Punica granatum TaxID=22663 RepID=A0A2I0I8W3_PUNGR|nr:hypothetical protein CRG98_039198 [Punica granatum]